MQHVESERRTMMKQYPDFYPLAAAFVLVGIGVAVGWLLFADHDGYGMNLWTEVLSIGVTVAVIDRLNRRRTMQERKTELIQQLGSESNDFALEAVRLLQQMDILTDGSLKDAELGHANLSGAHLVKANLSGANLRLANLSGAYLEFADLSGADLYAANLSGADLKIADLSGADLRQANLSGATLFSTNLSGADLTMTKLSGANLYNANLSGAILEHTTFDENTILPRWSKWTPDTDMDRFTNPKHPNFWRLIVWRRSPDANEQ